MTRQTMRIVLASGVMIAVGLAGVAAAKSTTTTKTSDRLPIARMEEAQPGRVAALGVAPGAGPEAGEGEWAGPPAFAGPPPGPPPFGPPPFAPMGGPGSGPRMGPAGFAHHPPCRDPLAFARTLAAAEVALGIRADQLDTWRAFTDALQAVAPPPPPPPPGRGPKADAAGKPAGTPDAMGAVEALAGRLKEDGAAGERLLQAAQALKARLSPDQLQRLARVGPALMPRPRHMPFPPPPAAGAKAPGPR